MKRFLMMGLLMAAACSSTSPSAKDPYSLLWVQNHIHQAPRSTYHYGVDLVKVNQQSAPWYSLADLDSSQQACGIEFDGVPQGGAMDSLLIRIAFVKTVDYADTILSPSFQPLVGATPDSAAVWKIEFTDTTVNVTQLPVGSTCAP